MVLPKKLEIQGVFAARKNAKKITAPTLSDNCKFGSMRPDFSKISNSDELFVFFGLFIPYGGELCPGEIPFLAVLCSDEVEAVYFVENGRFDPRIKLGGCWAGVGCSDP